MRFFPGLDEIFHIREHLRTGKYPVIVVTYVFHLEALAARHFTAPLTIGKGVEDQDSP